MWHRGLGRNCVFRVALRSCAPRRRGQSTAQSTVQQIRQETCQARENVRCQWVENLLLWCPSRQNEGNTSCFVKGWSCCLLTYLPYSMRHQLRISYFWPDWNSYVRLGVFNTIFSTKEVTFLFFPPNLSLKILNHQILHICRLLYRTICAF